MNYDAVVVGGGLGGSVLAEQVARAGHRVLVLERETQFKDRVRGENFLAWGVASARRLGIYGDLIAAGGHAAPNWIVYVMGQPTRVRDLSAETPGGDPMLNIYHPRMQDAMIARAVAAGAIVRRGATVLCVDAAPGRLPVVTYEVDGARRTVSARIVVGADGRASQVRSWAEFDVVRTPEILRVAGMLIQGSSVPEGGAYFAVGPGVASFWAPQGSGRARVYFVYPGASGDRHLTSKSKVPEFLRAVESAGVPASWLDGVESVGPLAEFEGADRHVRTPAKNGVVLVGDAAGASDPSWGSGLSLTLLDVEHLAAALRSCDDWNVAIARYACEHDRYYDALHRIHTWMTELAWTPGPDADARRERVMPKWIAQVEGFPDLVGLGPFGPSDEGARRMTLGLD